MGYRSIPAPRAPRQTWRLERRRLETRGDRISMVIAFAVAAAVAVLLAVATMGREPYRPRAVYPAERPECACYCYPVTPQMETVAGAGR